MSPTVVHSTAPLHHPSQLTTASSPQPRRGEEQQIGIREVTSALHYTRDAAHYLAFHCPVHQSPDLTEPQPAEIVFNFSGGVREDIQTTPWT